MPSVEEHLLALADRGVEDDVLGDLRKAYEASPIRAERDAAQKEAASLRSKLAEQNFAAVGVKVNPGALNVPSDLDVTDVEKVRGWAVEMGLAEVKPDVPNEELESHARVTAASTGSQTGTPDVKAEARNKAFQATNAQEFWQAAAAGGFTNGPYSPPPG